MVNRRRPEILLFVAWAVAALGLPFSSSVFAESNEAAPHFGLTVDAPRFDSRDLADRANGPAHLRPFHTLGREQGAADRDARFEALSAMLESAWSVDLAHLRDVFGADADFTAAADPFRAPVRGGDLNGDGTRDVIVVEVHSEELVERDVGITVVRGDVALRALSGLDGTELWLVELPNLGGPVFPLPASDMTGDGRDDVLVLSFEWDRFENDAMRLTSIQYHDTFWSLALISGADGRTDGVDAAVGRARGGLVPRRGRPARGRGPRVHELPRASLPLGRP